MDSSNSHSSCDWAGQLLFDHREGRLDLTEAETLRSHLETCPSCRENEIRENRLRDLVRDLPLPSPPTGLGEQVHRRLRQRRRWRVMGGVATAAGILLAVGLVTWQNWPRPTQISVPDRPDVPPRVEVANDLPVAPVLFAAPPVDSLDLLGRQQAGYVTALKQLEKE